eukprot:TRINITY_DN1760_c0_g1_i2.p1 TRINITY_DN1760_c0_g1~~TRINITY_DN1760_c0_g1_i2.p1  ORF type:complete len:122 (+),score=16.87 TRINITY_DN1760_c0_g1_i2:703-1068(+)
MVNYYIVISPGSTSDQSVFRLSRTRQIYLEHGGRAFADRGFPRSETSLLTPSANPNNSSSIDQYNASQYKYRSEIETVFARVKTFKAAETKFKQSPTIQVWALLLAYQIKSSPMRNDNWFD